MFLKRLRESDRPLVGTFVKLPTLETAEILATAGFDFVVIDTEHALLSQRDVYTLVVGYSRMSVAPLVRVADHGYGDAQRYLDAGAAGILVPHVENAQEAQEVFAPLMFPPDGSRGMGLASRAGLWGALPDGADAYVRTGREDIAKVAMIESRGAVAGLPGILATPGLDAAFVGPGDLSLDLGLPATAPEVRELVSEAIAVAVMAGIPVGTVASEADQIRALVDEGCSFVLVSNDTGMILDGARRAIHEARRALASTEAVRMPYPGAVPPAGSNPQQTAFDLDVS